MNRLFLIASISIIFFASCNSNVNTKTEKTVNLVDSINYYETILFANSDGNIKIDEAIKLANFYKKFAINNVNDSVSPYYLFKSADIFMNMNKANDAINSFNLILEKYPNFEKTPSVLFLKAFIFEDQLTDYVNAEKYYKQFLEKYPKSEFADDAEISLKNLGKTPEQLIEEFEKMNK